MRKVLAILIVTFVSLGINAQVNDRRFTPSEDFEIDYTFSKCL